MNVTKLFTIDTNILIYATDTAEGGKRQKAAAILERMIKQQCVLPLQCLNEFYSATTKKGLLPSEQAQRVVERALNSSRIIPPSPEDLRRAMKTEGLHHVQFYDALLWATSYGAGCTIFSPRTASLAGTLAGFSCTIRLRRASISMSCCVSPAHQDARLCLRVAGWSLQ